MEAIRIVLDARKERIIICPISIKLREKVVKRITLGIVKSLNKPPKRYPKMNIIEIAKNIKEVLWETGDTLGRSSHFIKREW